jgi:hypothetical protein
VVWHGGLYLLPRGSGSYGIRILSVLRPSQGL